MGRKPCCEKVGLKRGPWTIEEDKKLVNFILSNGILCWRLMPKLAGLMRCGKSCRLRWTNYLRPDLKRGGFSEEEEDQIIELHSQLGNRWSKIASHFPGRTDNEIKNHWNTRIKKRLALLGVDPVTHNPIHMPDQNSHGSICNVTEDCEGKSMEINAEGQDKKFGVLRDEERGVGNVIVDSTSCSASTSSSLNGDLCWVDAIDSFPLWDSLDFFDDVLSLL